MKFIIPGNEKELAALHERINSTDIVDIKDEDIEGLGKIMVESDSSGLRDIIAIKFADLKNESCIYFLVEALKRNIHTKFVSTLIYACSKYDCAEYLQIFVDVLILKKDMAFLDAWYTIKGMKKYIPESERIYAINKLKAFLSTQDNDYELHQELESAIVLLEGRESREVN